MSASLKDECIEVRQAALSALPHIAETNDKSHSLTMGPWAGPRHR